MDLATAVGIREYKPKSHRHLFAPQLLYTLYVFKGLRLGGSLVTLRDIDKKYKIAFDKALKSGVKILCYDCKLSNEEIKLNNRINYEY